MSYRDDLDAALARTDALEEDLAEARDRRDAALARCRALEYRLAHPDEPVQPTTAPTDRSVGWMVLAIVGLFALVVVLAQGAS